MTPATETSEERPAETDFEPMPSADEMRLARRRGVIEGILQRCAFTAEQIALSEGQIADLVAADAESEPAKARALAASISTESGEDDPIAGDIVIELRVIDEPFPGSDTTEVVDPVADPAIDVRERAADSESVDAALEAIGTTEPVDGPTTAAPPALASESPNLPVHRAICMADGCKTGVLYRPTASGAGFAVLERYGMGVDTLVGISSNGRPICPVGDHGEMTLADEQLPVEQAITEVNKKLDAPKDRRLPFPAQPFNWEGAGRHIIEQRHEVKRLEKKWEDLKERTKEAKDAFDKGNEKLGEMIDEYEERADEREYEIERRQSQAAAGHPEGTTLVRCVWEKQHPDLPCPLCESSAQTIEGRNAVIRLLGVELLPRDAQGHVDQVLAYHEKKDLQDTLTALDGVVFDIKAAAILEWSPADRAAVRTWAEAVDRDTDRPAVLGTPHVAAAVTGEAKVQTCATCGGVIRQLDDAAEAYPTGALVRTDCAGAEKEVGHRYPERGKKKPAARARGITKPVAPPAQPAEKRQVKPTAKKAAPKNRKPKK